MGFHNTCQRPFLRNYTINWLPLLKSLLCYTSLYLFVFKSQKIHIYRYVFKVTDFVIFAKFAKLEQKIKNTCEKFITLLFKIRVLQFFWKPQNKGFYIQKDFFALNGGTFSLTMHTPTTKQNRVLFIYIRYLSILPYSASMLNIVRRKWMKITLKGI